MTTFTEARDELVAALEAAAVPVAASPGARATPCALVYGDGADLAHVARGAVRARFRITLLAGSWTQDTATALLDPLKAGTLAAVRGLAAWQFDEVRRDAVATIAGGSYLAADIVASRMVDI